MCVGLCAGKGMREGAGGGEGVAKHFRNGERVTGLLRLWPWRE